MRLIGRLDIKNKHVVKGKMYEGVKKVDTVENCLKKVRSFTDKSSFMSNTELFINDSVASLYGWKNYFQKNGLDRNSLNVPLTLGGGIRSVGDACALLCFCEKVSINSFLFEDQNILDSLSGLVGAQSVTVALDFQRIGHSFFLTRYHGKDLLKFPAANFLNELKGHAFGELFISAVNFDHTSRGMETDLIDFVRDNFPNKTLVYGCGLKSLENLDQFEIAGISGVISARAFQEKVLTSG